MRLSRYVLTPLLLLPAAGIAQERVPDRDGRLYGHFPYGDVAEHDLVEAPAGFAIGQPCYVQRVVIPDLTRLIDAARRDPAVMGTLRGLSCHRTIARQRSVFDRGGPVTDADRAISVAPPAHSEHATGFAIDFAVRPSPNCPDAEACMAATPAARWLLANAPKYGFELSFPPGSAQNVKWEPWHWRWVGTTMAEPGAARARFTFAKARARFPANPAVAAPISVLLRAQPPLPPAPPVPAKSKRKKRR